MAKTLGKPSTPKQVLQAWAEKNEIKPSDFAARMGYSYNHAFQLLKGNKPVTIEVIGRLTLFYGYEVIKPIADAMQREFEVEPV